MQLRNIRLAVVAAGFCLCPSLFAVGYTWDFPGSAGTNCIGNARSCSAASTGNSMLFNSAGGATIKATAWYVGQNGTFQAATLGQYAGGLGVCYPGENCTTLANQQLSNQLSGGFSFDEFILFEFGKPVDPSSMNIRSLPIADWDVLSFLVRKSAHTLNLTDNT